MKTKNLITTTNGIENHKITQYIELVSANIVIGANFFSDFKASFTDLFGGNSKTYQKKLDEVYAQALAQIDQKASEVGANAVVGLKVDFGEVSGGGKSMFMVSAIGTAVRIEQL